MANKITQRLEDLKTSFDRLSSRERVMVGGLGAAVALILIFGIGLWIVSGLDELAEENEALEQALRDIGRHRDAYLKQRRRMAQLQARMGHGALELNSFVEKAAKSVGVTIAESGEVSPIPADQYTRRGLEIKLHKVTLGQLSSLVKTIEAEQAHIVQVTQLSVSTRWKRNQELDIELVVSTYELSKEPVEKPKRGGRS